MDCRRDISGHRARERFCQLRAVSSSALRGLLFNEPNRVAPAIITRSSTLALRSDRVSPVLVELLAFYFISHPFCVQSGSNIERNQMPGLCCIEEGEKIPFAREPIESSKRIRAPASHMASLITSGELGVAWVVYWNKLLSSLLGRGNREPSMTTKQSIRRASFGINCVHCRCELMAPDSSEFWSDGRACYVWHCPECSCCFGSLVLMPVGTQPIKDIMTTNDICRSLLLAC